MEGTNIIELIVKEKGTSIRVYTVKHTMNNNLIIKGSNGELKIIDKEPLFSTGKSNTVDDTRYYTQENWNNRK